MSACSQPPRLLASCSGRLTPGDRTLVRIGFEATWVQSRPGRSRDEKNLCPLVNQMSLFRFLNKQHMQTEQKRCRVSELDPNRGDGYLVTVLMQFQFVGLLWTVIERRELPMGSKSDLERISPYKNVYNRGFYRTSLPFFICNLI